MHEDWARRFGEPTASQPLVEATGSTTPSNAIMTLGGMTGTAKDDAVDG